MLRKHYERMQFEALHPKNEPKAQSFSEEESKPVKLSHENKIASIKDVKPIDGLEFEWKDGKMKPADQKTYRSKYDEQ